MLVSGARDHLREPSDLGGDCGVSGSNDNRHANSSHFHGKGVREVDEGPGLTWRQLTPRHRSGTWDSKIRGTVTRDGAGWVAYLRLDDPPGLSPITTVGRFDTVEAALVAADEVWASR